MELIIVVITLGVIASLALSNYNNIVEQSYCHNAQMNLMAIYNASKIRGIKDPSTDITSANTATVNANLRLNINDANFNYTYNGAPNGFMSFAIRTDGPSYSCRVRFNPNDLTCTNNNFCPSVFTP